MSRPMPRIWVLTAVLGTCLAGLSRPAQAQLSPDAAGMGGIFSDPFTFYYSVYLPSQAAYAMRPRPMDTINAATAQRQMYAAVEQRRSLYDPASPYAAEEFDPLSHYSDQKGAMRRTEPYRFVQDPSNSDGHGPGAFYDRAAQYYPGLRQGRASNANLFKGRPRGRGGFGGMGGMGMGGMGMGGMGMGGMGMGGMGMGGMY